MTTLNTQELSTVETSIKETIAADVEKQLTVEEREEAAMNQAIASNASRSPEELYAQLFYLYMPKFKNEVRGMSNKMLRRLLTALVEGPLSDKAEKSMQPGERMVLAMASNLMQARMGMEMAVMSEKIRSDQEQEELNKQAASVSFAGASEPVVENKEVVNGQE